jgi:hypothetical protein
MAQVNNNVVDTKNAIALHDVIVGGRLAEVANIVSQLVESDYVKVKSPADIGACLLWFATYGKHGLSPLQLNTVLTELTMQLPKLNKAQKEVVLAAGYSHPDSGVRAQFGTMAKILGQVDFNTWTQTNSPRNLWKPFEAVEVTRKATRTPKKIAKSEPVKAGVMDGKL